MFRNVNLSNPENAFQGNLAKEKTKKKHFIASGGTSFENFSATRQPWLCLHGFDVCNGLPKKSFGYVTELCTNSNDIYQVAEALQYFLQKKYRWQNAC